MKFASETNHGKLIAYWQDLAGYYRDETGIVWCDKRQSGFVICGEIDNETLAKRFRVTAFV